MATNLDIQKMYIAYFGRPADVSGLTYWTNQITQANGDASAVINAFSASAEYADNYAGKSNEFIVNSLYNNLFGRDAEVDGLTYWSGKLLDGTFNVGNVAWAIMSGAQNEDVTALGNKATAAQTFTDSMDTTTEILGYSGSSAAAAAKAWLVTVTDTQASLDDAVASVDTAVANTVAAGSASQGQTFTLTTGVDTFTPTTTVEADRTTDGNDTFNALIDGTTNAVATTLTALDTIDGGAGKDTINLNILNGSGVAGTAVTALPSTSVTNVEVLNIRSAVGVTADTSAWTGLTNANVTQGTAVTLTAAATTDVSVKGASGTITTIAGKDVSITATGNTIDSKKAAGTVTVNDAGKTGTATNIDVLNGTDVTVNATTDTTGDIDVGNTGALAAADAPTGDVEVNSTFTALAATDDTASTVSVDGGKTITVNQMVTSTDAVLADTTGQTITQGAVTITGQNTTTAVTVNQAASTAAVAAVVGVEAVASTSVVTFKAMAATETTIVNGLTFTATKALTAEQVAQAFANLTLSDLQANGGITPNGYYTNTNTTVWTSGDADGATVTYSAVAGSTKPVVSGTAGTAAGSAITAAAASTATAGTAAKTAKDGVTGVINGTVNIADGGTDSITTISVDGYGALSVIDADALTTLSLANSGGATAGATDADMTLTTASTGTLDLTLNNVKGIVSLDGGSATLTGLNITTAGKDSASAMVAGAVTALTVAGTNALDLSGGTFTALKTVTVSGAAGLKMAASGANVTAVDASATSGNNTIALDADLATYKGGTGSDTVDVTAASTNVVKAITLGAGDDTLVLGAITVTTGSIDAGTGTDTLSMTAAAADAADANATFAGKVTNFEKLLLTGAIGVQTVAVDVLGSYNYVIVDGQTDDGAGADEDTTITGLGANGTVVVTDVIGLAADDDRLVVTLADASGDSDVTNIGVSKAGILAAGEVVVAGVETINVSANDTTVNGTTVLAGANAQSLELTATSATTINVAGNSDFTLTTTGNTLVTLIDGSSMTGKLTATTAASVAKATIKGGSGDDNLTAANTNDTIYGGAGDDTIVVGATAQSVSLFGGAGKDTFDVSGFKAAGTGSSVLINDIASGDVIKLATSTNFNSNKTTVTDASLDAYITQAMVDAGGIGGIAWFQTATDTYIVQDLTAIGFHVNEDILVKISGLVDLSTASFNSAGTLEIA